MPLDTFLSFKIHRLDCLKHRIICVCVCCDFFPYVLPEKDMEKNIHTFHRLHLFPRREQTSDDLTFLIPSYSGVLVLN